MMTQNTEHGPRATDHDQDPDWIRNAAAGNITIGTNDLSVLPQIMAAICEGEKFYCEHCGAESPMWPTRAWAVHILTAHATNLTDQALAEMGVMCDPSLPPAQQNFFSMLFSCRVSMRRRAWQLGHAKVVGAKAIISN